MKKIPLYGLAAALATAAAFSGPAQAATINILWYTYADPASEYRQKISELSGVVQTFSQTGGLNWNLTYWEPGGATPNLTSFNVLVIESGEAFRTGAPNGALATPDYSGILNNRAAIEAARGDRTFITAADSDFHAVRGDTGNIPDDPNAPDGGGKCSPAISSPDCWDGALGHSVNAINWAASGNGLGIVSFLDGEFNGSFWWTHPDSFLHDELAGKVSYSGSEQAPVINPVQALYPLNYGLTSQGLSDWDNSFHAFISPISGYTAIVDSSTRPGFAVALATSLFADAPTTPITGLPVTPIDEPGTLLLVSLGLAFALLRAPCSGSRRTSKRNHRMS
jgi:hypothetical protein